MLMKRNRNTQGQKKNDEREINAMKTKINDLQKQLHDKAVILNRLQEELNGKKIQNEDCKECKELKSKLGAMTEKYNELYREYDIDVDQYSKWNTEQILNWILSLDNGRFSKYADILSAKLKEQNIIGEDLEEVTNLVVKQWGVQDKNDKRILTNHIQALCSKRNSNVAEQAYYDNIEGAQI
eukprot:24824_1